MKTNLSIQIKAVLLLIVFSMNTIAGFACAMGVDMGFNSKHHNHDSIKTNVHVHADGRKHKHYNEVTKHHQNSKEDSEQGGCCNDGVIKFQSLDKALFQNSNASIISTGYVTLFSNYFDIDFFTQQQVSNLKYIFGFPHPPPSDIRVLIQSFQI